MSDLSALPKGLRIAGLRDGARDGTDGLEQHLAQGVQHRRASVRGAQHLASSTTAWRSSSPAAPSIETPIHIVIVTGGDGKPVTAHPRVLVVAGANSQVRIAQTFIGAPDDVYFNNAVAEVVVGEGAIVDYYTDQRESERAFHIANLQAHVVGEGRVRVARVLDRREDHAARHRHRR